MQSETTGDYHVTFLSEYPDDKHLCHDKERQWPEWNEYKLNENNVLVYWDIMLFSPKRKPYMKICML